MLELKIGQSSIMLSVRERNPWHVVTFAGASCNQVSSWIIGRSLGQAACKTADHVVSASRDSREPGDTLFGLLGPDAVCGLGTYPRGVCTDNPEHFLAHLHSLVAL